MDIVYDSITKTRRIFDNDEYQGRLHKKGGRKYGSTVPRGWVASFERTSKFGKQEINFNTLKDAKEYINNI